MDKQESESITSATAPNKDLVQKSVADERKRKLPQYLEEARELTEMPDFVKLLRKASIENYGTNSGWIFSPCGFDGKPGYTLTGKHLVCVNLGTMRMLQSGATYTLVSPKSNQSISLAVHDFTCKLAAAITKDYLAGSKSIVLETDTAGELHLHLQIMTPDANLRGFHWPEIYRELLMAHNLYPKVYESKVPVELTMAVFAGMHLHGERPEIFEFETEKPTSSKVAHLHEFEGKACQSDLQIKQLLVSIVGEPSALYLLEALRSVFSSRTSELIMLIESVLDDLERPENSDRKIQMWTYKAKYCNPTTESEAAQLAELERRHQICNPSLLQIAAKVKFQVEQLEHNTDVKARLDDHEARLLTQSFTRANDVREQDLLNTRVTLLEKEYSQLKSLVLKIATASKVQA